jgi:hypothetical protein
VTLRYRALLIGNASYPDDEANLPRLDGPMNDVPALRTALGDEEYGLFAPENVAVRVVRVAA